MKVLVLGASGMAGHVIFKRLQDTGHDVHGTRYRNAASAGLHQLDATDLDAVQELLTSLRPDVVVNAIGLLVEESSADPVLAIKLNALLPHRLSQIAKEINARLIHISTDCVFSGKTSSYYTEKSFKDAKDFYGRSKALGELENEIDLTIRTSIIGPKVGDSKSGLFEWALRQSGTIQGYSNVFWSGVTTLILAEAIEAVLKQKLVGVYHLTNGTPISKYDLLTLINREFDLNLKIEQDNRIISNKALVDTRQELAMTVPDYQTMMEQMRSYVEMDEMKTPYKGSNEKA